jgi:hypothetical protein
MQPADDSRHAVRIAFRQKTLEIIEGDDWLRCGRRRSRSTTPHRQLMEAVLAAFAQFDNDVRSERIRVGMKAALELGR